MSMWSRFDVYLANTNNKGITYKEFIKEKK